RDLDRAQRQEGAGRLRVGGAAMKTVLILLVIAVVLGIALAVAVATAADKLDRNVRPTPGPAAPVATPRIERTTLKNGLPVWVITRHELPMVNALLQIRAGASLDGAKPGLASMTASLLDEGTTTRSALEMAKATDALGALLSAVSGIEPTTVTMQTLSKHLEPSLALMGEMVVHPAFAADEVERDRKLR